MKPSRRWFTIALVAVVGLVGSAGCTDDSGDQAKFCARSLDSAKFNDTFSNDFDASDVPSALAAFTTARDEVQRLRDLAPEAVRADVDVLLDYLDRMIEGLEAADPDSSERPDIYDELRTRTDEVSAASSRIAQYVTANCTTTTT